MKEIFNCVFNIKPQSKQSTRFGMGRAYTSSQKLLYVKSLKEKAKRSMEGSCSPRPLILSVEFVFPHKKKRGLHNKRPDIDNLLKPLKDALSGVVYKDDSQVCSINAIKTYGELGKIKVKVFEVALNQEEVER